MRHLVAIVVLVVVAIPAAAQSLAGGGAHTLFLKSDGTVWAVGSNVLSDLPKSLPLFDE